MAGRALVLRIKPPAASCPIRASITDAYGPIPRFGPARSACVRRGHQSPIAGSTVCPESITFPRDCSPLQGPVKARGAVSSLRCGPHQPRACLLDSPLTRAPCHRGRWTQERRWQHSQSGDFIPTAPNRRKAGSES